jgi:dTDP-4-dehydrorhamnose reductase
MKVFVFGKTGQLARCLQNQADVIAVGRDIADLTQPNMCAALVAQTDADIIINAAAYTAVDAAERDTETAELVNHTAVAAMAEAAVKRDLPFIHISTDYVFPGTGTSDWKPNDETSPLSVYGATKRRGEEAVVAAGGRHVILRTSWVHSAYGNNFVKTMLKLGRSRPELRIVGDQVGGPTSADDIAKTVLRIAQQHYDGPAPSGIYHYAGQPNVSWAGFATEIFQQAVIDCVVTPIPTQNYPTPAERPQNSRLDCTILQRDFGMLPPDWRVSLGQILTDLRETS